MIAYGTLEVKSGATTFRGFFRPARGYKAAISLETEMVLIENCVNRLDQYIKSLTNVEQINRDVAMPQIGDSIVLQAHDTACILTWPEWFKNATDFAKLSLLIDWRRAMLDHRETAHDRPKTALKEQLSLEALERKRQGDKERKRKSREKMKHARVVAGLWKPRGRPKKVL